MSELVSLLAFREGTTDSDRAAFASAIRDHLPGEALVAPALPGGRNAGDLIVRATVAGAPSGDFGMGSAFAEAIASADGALYDIAAGAGDACATAIYRTALFHTFRDPTAQRLARFATETIAMPRRMPFIRAWALGRVTRSWGRFAWDYVWEQGYDQLEDLTSCYMNHPCHWGQVDRWFDPEHPDWLIEPGLCHAFCRNDGSR